MLAEDVKLHPQLTLNLNVNLFSFERGHGGKLSHVDG